MLQIIQILLSLAIAQESNANSTAETVRQFLPDSSFRLVSGKNCPDGEIKWAENMLIFGSGAHPLLFHSFDKETTNVQNIPEAGINCETKTHTEIKISEKNNLKTMNLTQKIVEKCEKTNRTSSHVINVTKRSNKTVLELKSKSFNQLSGNKTCVYEK